MPLVRRTRATLRSAEFGFFGVCVITRVQTPRFCGAPRSAGVFVLDFGVSRPLRTSWLTVGTALLRKWLWTSSHRKGRQALSVPANQGRTMVADRLSPPWHKAHELVQCETGRSDGSMVISAIAAGLALLAAVGALLLAWASRRRSRQRFGDVVTELDRLLTDLAERLRVALEPLVVQEPERSALWLAFDLDELLARLAQEAAERTGADAAAAQVRGAGTGNATGV